MLLGYPPPARVFLVLLAFVLADASSLHGPAVGADPIEPPGFTPRPTGLHALVNARVMAKPGSDYSNATVVLRDGTIEAVGPGLAPPPGARIWDMAGLTIYPGFVDAHVVRPATSAPAAPPAPATADASPNPQDVGSGVASDPRFLGVPGQEQDPGGPGPGSAIPDVTPQVRLADGYTPDAKLNESLREVGFTVANLAPERGIFRGTGVAVALGHASPNRSILRPQTAQHVSFSPLPGRDGYPNSLMGAIAVVRQTGLDARWHRDRRKASPESAGAEFNTALDALQPLLDPTDPLPVTFEPGSILMADRAVRLAAELGWSPRILASGQEWRRPDLLAGMKAPFIVPVVFPAAPKLPTDADWEAVPLDLLRQWDWAPENPAVLRRAGLEVALTTSGLSDRKDFRRHVRAAIDRGLSEADALAALTTVPARLCGLADRLGTIEPGKRAFLTVVDGSYFAPTSHVRSVWIDGVAFQFPSPRAEANPGPKPAATTNAVAAAKPTDPDKRLARNPMNGRGPLLHPPAVLVRNATLWTGTTQGVVRGALLAVGGRITSVGPEPASLPEGVLVIDAAGGHVSPGIIDCHSHSMILGAVNEASLPSTAMVRIADVVNSESENIHQQLAGGVTAVNLLHGSANPIGGQNCVIKLRDGQPPSGLVLADAPAGIKFALGENVKQSNAGDRNTTRFPQTRMGVGTFYINRFTAARHYASEWQRWRDAGQQAPAPRRDLELEALAEILQGSRLIHCHSYRQDEILAFLRTMEAFNVRVATLQHILEGYKVADEIARHGAGASAFADWWAYKFEVLDAIPYAGSLMHQRGVLVSFNSDSSDHARRLNFEAAKAVKYGGTPEPDALRFVTTNPARQLRIDHRVGALAPGLDADFVLWSGNPLDSSSTCLETWIEGARYFSRAREAARVADLREEHAALVAKARKASKGAAKPDNASPAKADAARALFFQRALEHARSLGVVECQDCDLSSAARP